MNKLKLGVLGLIIIGVPLLTLAATATYKVQSGDTWQSIAVKQGITLDALMTLNEPTKGQNVIVPGVVVPPAPTSTPTTTPPVIGESRFIAYITGYGYPDNTPAGSAISNPVLHSTAGGTGTFADPITFAVGHSIINGKDILDYPAGTKMYEPNLRKYFIAEDTCGDGNKPQNGPCHTGFQGHPWLDIWVGGSSATKSATLNCEDTITDLHLVIINPASNYAVIAGSVFNGSCATQFGDTIVTQ